MKKLKFVLISIVLSMGLLSTAIAQNGNISTAKAGKVSVRKAKRLEKKRLARMRYKKLLESKNYVFQADHLKMTNGQSIDLSSDVNFFAVRGDTAVLQFVFKSLNRVSSNGLGGITAKGIAERYQLRSANEKKAMMVTTYIFPRGSSGSAYVVLTVGNHGYGQLDVTVNGSQFSMTGQVSPPANAKIFEGHTIFKSH